MLFIEKWQRKDSDHNWREENWEEEQVLCEPECMLLKHFICWCNMFLTDDDESKAIAQVSQVCHKVHQKQQLGQTKDILGNKQTNKEINCRKLVQG